MYDVIKATSFTRIHGKPSWQAKEMLICEGREQAIKQWVGYDLAGPYGLLAEIIGAV